MAEQEAVPVSVEAPLDHPHKRKLDDLEPPPPSDVAPPDSTSELDGDGDGDVNNVDENEDENGVDEGSEHAKRPRSDDAPDGLASANGHNPEEEDEQAAVNAETTEAVENPETAVDNLAGGDEKSNEAVPEEANEVQPASESEQKVDSQVDDSEDKDVQVPSSENEQLENVEKPSWEELNEPVIGVELEREGDGASGQHNSEFGARTRKIEIPNNKVGVLIGKAGDTIKYLQINSGAKIQITRDADADPHASTRPVELVGTLESLSKAERLIKEVIAEADAGGSPSLVARGFTAAMTSGSAEIEMHVPGDKVGLIIGKGGETIRSLQTRSGARIQLIPQSFPGDQSKEKKVKVTGDKKQVEVAKELIKEVMNQLLPGRPSQFPSNNYSQQQAYCPRGPSGPPQWGSHGPPQPTPYDYQQQRGPYPSHNQPYPGQSYGNYPSQGPPRGSGFGSGWEHRPPQQGPPHSGGYDYYGQGGHTANAPVSVPQSAHQPGHHVSAPSMAPPHSQPNYNYGQPQRQSRGADYPQPAPYSQNSPAPQGYTHGYGHGEPKYDSQGQVQVQQPYGGPTSGYPPQQSGYAPQQPYNRPPPSYGVVPSQGAPPQGYAPPTATQPADPSYQAPVSAHQPPYGQNMQQPPNQYPYASGPTTQAPYGSAPAPVTYDGYTQPQPSAAGYPHQGGQPPVVYGQQAGAGYPQAAAPTASYGQYPSVPQPGYSDPSAAAGAATYGYPGQVDPSAYAAGQQAYSTAPAVAQQGYALPQPVPAQPGYDPSAAAAQSGGYASAPVGAPPAGYAKTVSPQLGYPQYDASQQMYAAPR